jgi:uncharacterized delta-60 repeat protein
MGNLFRLGLLASFLVSLHALGAEGFTQLSYEGKSPNAEWSFALADGSFLLAGNLHWKDGMLGHIDGFLLKLTPQGLVDTSFGKAGWVHFPHLLKGVELLPDGKILAAATHYDERSQTGGFWVSKFLSDGALDLSFGTAGTVLENFGRGEAPVSGLVVRPDGSVFVYGILNQEPAKEGTVPRVAILALTAQGKKLLGFGNQGTLTYPSPPGKYYGDLVVPQPGGGVRIFCFEQNDASPDAPFLGRLIGIRPDGTLDTSFGEGGSRLVTLRASTFVAAALPLDDGGILLTGDYRGPDLALRSGWVARIASNGALDPGFGKGGVAPLPLMGRGLAVGPEGGFWVSGAHGKKTLLSFARLTPTGALDTTFGEGGMITDGVHNQGIKGMTGTIVVDRATRKLILTSTSFQEEPVPAFREEELVVVRFTPDGVRDLASFGAGLLTPPKPTSSPNAAEDRR